MRREGGTRIQTGKLTGTRKDWPAVLVPHPRNESLGYHVPAISFVIITATGALDDVKQIRPLAKLAGQVLAISVAAAGACLGFLKYNFHPASIFLGDAGSLLLRYSLGVISLLNVSRTAALTTLLIPLVVAGVPILDTFSAIVRRLRAHVSVGQADKGHIHHCLM